MYTFWLVIKDLFWFVLGKEVSVVEGTVTPLPFHALPARPQTTLLADVVKPILLANTPPVTTEKDTPESTVSPLSSLETEPDDSIPDANMALLHAPVVMYVCNEAGSPRYTAPQLEFDGIVERVPCGAAVTVVGYRGRYASVLRGGHTGWILKDDLAPDKNSVWPQFVVRHEYLASEPDTIKLRAIIEDIFGAGESELPLQAGEYIMFRLLMEHRTISWPQTRPRLPGTWQSILRGVTGIHSTIMPKTDSIMEWSTEYGEGRLAYVEAVSPDNTISLTLVGLHEAGQYETLTLTDEEWRELRPVFIEVA